MKKFISVLLAVIMCFALASCSGNGEETTTSDSSEDLNSVPILGVEIKNDDEAGFYALTKNGTFTWTVTHENGETEQRIYDGSFCLESENLCTFTREQTGGSVTLKFTGTVESYKIYSAEKSELDSKDKTEIISEKYLLSSDTSKITFPESGEYYYVVDVKYAQGDISYGFLLAE